MPAFDETAERVERICEKLDGYADGVHRLAEPARLLDAGLPAPLAEVYRRFDGAELFHESLVLYPSTSLAREGRRAQVGVADGDGIWIDLDSGAVFRREEDTGEWLEEGTSFDRWLEGAIDAEACCYDRDGEFVGALFDALGELLPDAVITRERAALRRDRKAPAPRWRLARALARKGEVEAARAELEEVIAVCPGFAWAWFDLARASEALGEVGAAREEMEEAARADEGYEHAGFFWAHAARLAAAGGDEAARRRAAARALELSPDLVRAQVAGARERLADDERDQARELLELARALAPRDLEVLDLAEQLE